MRRAGRRIARTACRPSWLRVWSSVEAPPRRATDGSPGSSARAAREGALHVVPDGDDRHPRGSRFTAEALVHRADDDRRARPEVVAGPEHEFERLVAHDDDRVERAAGVLEPVQRAQALLVVGCREPGDIHVLGLDVDPGRPDRDEVRADPRGDRQGRRQAGLAGEQDEDRLLVVLSPDVWSPDV